MTNPLIHTFISLAENLAQDEPEIVAMVQAVLAKENPTAADWLAVHQAALVSAYGEIAAVVDSGASHVSPPVTTTAVQSSVPISQPGALAAKISALVGSKSGSGASSGSGSQTSEAPISPASKGYAPDVG